MIDLLGRAGRLDDDAQKLMKSMSFEPDAKFEVRIFNNFRNSVSFAYSCIFIANKLPSSNTYIEAC